MGHDHAPGSEGQGQMARSTLTPTASSNPLTQPLTLTRSVWPRSSIEDSFQCYCSLYEEAVCI